MEIDRQTFRDLEIFKVEGDNPSIFELLNQTRTLGGGEKLRRFFLKPKSSVDEIIEVQKILKYIINSGSGFIFPNTIEPLKVEQYLESNIVPISHINFFLSLFESIWTRYRYPEIYHNIYQGLKITGEYLREIQNYFLRNKKDDFPDLLKEIFSQLETVLTKTELKYLAKKSNPREMTPRLAFVLDRMARKKLKKELVLLVETIYQLELYVGLTINFSKYNLVFPEFIDSEKPLVSIKNLYHLFVKNPVKNDFIFKDEKNLIFLTGPNMAGKTTFMKAAGVAIYLAHLGMGVPASGMELTLFNCLYSGINAADDIRLGYSYYYGEVMRIREAADILQKERVFILFDELFKGTNVMDACEATRRVVAGFANCRTSLFLISSHLIELEKDIKKIRNLAFMCFEATVKNNIPKFNYQLKEGVSRQRLGLLLLENEKVFKLLDSLDKK